LTQDQPVGAITAGFNAGFSRLSMLILLAPNPLANECICHFFSPPSYDPEFWANSPVSCYGYALNDPAQPIANPGEYSNGGASSSAESLEDAKEMFLGSVERDLAAARFKGKRSSSSTSAEHGHYLVALLLAWSDAEQKAYYHFIRQDADNNWSDKPRNDKPIRRIAFSETMSLPDDQKPCTYTIVGYFLIPNNGVLLRKASSAPASAQGGGWPS